MVEEYRMPALYETENIPLEDKTIYQRWLHPLTDWYWLVAEYSPEENHAFGLAHGFYDEWGYFDMDELKDVGAYLDREWEPCKYRDAVAKITMERR